MIAEVIFKDFISGDMPKIRENQLKDEKLAYIKILKEAHEHCLKAVTLNQQHQQKVISDHNEQMRSHLNQVAKEVDLDPKMIDDILKQNSLK